MNELKHLIEFKSVLKTYSISEEVKESLQDVDLVLLASPTSSGCNTIIRELIKTSRFHFIVSDTTRKPRMNDGKMETNGVEYWFREEADVLQDLRDGKFLEAAVIHNQQVSGISLRELKRAEELNKIAIADVEMIGVESILRVKPNTTVVFLAAPDFEQWQIRLNKRGAMDHSEHIRRLESALHEFSHALEEPYYHLVINDTVDHAVAQIDAITKTEHLSKTETAINRQTIQNLKEQTRTFLENQ